VLWSFGAILKIMTNYPKLTYLYWDDPDIPVSLTGKAGLNRMDVGSTPTQETSFYLFWP
jgi:hypothetical protein